MILTKKYYNFSLYIFFIVNLLIDLNNFLCYLSPVIYLYDKKIVLLLGEIGKEYKAATKAEKVGFMDYLEKKYRIDIEKII